MNIPDAYKVIQSYAEKQTSQQYSGGLVCLFLRFETESDKDILREAILCLMKHCPYKFKKEEQPFYIITETTIFMQIDKQDSKIWGYEISIKYSDYFHAPRIEMVNITISLIQHEDLHTLQEKGYKNIPSTA